MLDKCLTANKSEEVNKVRDCLREKEVPDLPVRS